MTGERPDCVVVGELVIDPAAHEAWVGARRVSLTHLEFKLLLHLAKHPGWVFSREQLINEVWGYDYVGDTRLVSVHVGNLRKKLEAAGSQPELVETVRGAGYRLAKPAHQPALEASGSEGGDGMVPPPLPAAVIGRRREMQILHEVLEAAGGGQGSIVLLAGDAGIGKTHLAQGVAGEAAGRGARVVWVSCHELASSSPYWPWVQIVRALEDTQEAVEGSQPPGSSLSQLVTFVPELAWRSGDLLPAPGEQTGNARMLLFDSIVGLLRQASRESVLVLVVDDLEWCDQESLLVFRVLSAEVRRMRLLVIATLEDAVKARRRPLAETVGVLLENGARCLQLGPLDREETTELVGRCAGKEPSPGVVAAIYRQSEGNPLFAQELARLLAGEGRLASDTGSGIDELPLSPGIRDIVARRLDRLTLDCQGVLHLAALFDRAFDVRLLLAAVEIDVGRLLDLLTEALENRLIEPDGTPGRFRFTHPLTRQLIVAELGEARRLALHQKIAHALERVDTAVIPMSEVAYHYAQAAALGEADKAVAYARKAGESAMAQCGFEDAAAHFQRAVDLLPLVEADQRSWAETALGLRESAGDALLAAARPGDAITLYQQGLALLPFGPGLSRARLHRKIGDGWQADQRPDAALECYEAAERALPQAPNDRGRDDRQEWIEIQLSRMDSYYFKADLLRLAATIESVRERAISDGNEAQRDRLAAGAVALALRLDRYVVSDSTVAEARELWLASSGDPSLRRQCRAEYTLGFALLWSGRIDEGEHHLLACNAQAERAHDRYHQVLSATYLAVAARIRGDADAAQRWAMAAIHDASVAHLPGHLGTGKANLAWVALVRGDLSAAESNARDALALWRSPSAYPFEWLARWPLVALEIRRDDLRAAMDQVELLLAAEQQPPPISIYPALNCALIAWRGGRGEESRRHVCAALGDARGAWSVSVEP